MHLLLLLALAAVLWAGLLALIVACGYRHQSVKSHATHMPPATPEEGNHV
jgi:hypothetical protein